MVAVARQTRFVAGAQLSLTPTDAGVSPPLGSHAAVVVRYPGTIVV